MCRTLHLDGDSLSCQRSDQVQMADRCIDLSCNKHACVLSAAFVFILLTFVRPSKIESRSEGSAGMDGYVDMRMACDNNKQPTNSELILS